MVRGHGRFWLPTASDEKMQQVRITILNVDDTEAMRYQKPRVLRAAGYEVVEAGTGARALQLARELLPDLVMMDVKLPDMSGGGGGRRGGRGPGARRAPGGRGAAAGI